MNRYGVRGIIEAEPTETVKLTLIGDWRKADDDCCAEVIGTTPTGVGALALAGINFQGDKTRTIRQNLITRTEEDQLGHLAAGRCRSGQPHAHLDHRLSQLQQQ